MSDGEKMKDSDYACIIHVSALVSSFFWTVAFIPFLNIIVPLVLWLFKKDNPFVDFHGREAVRFQIFLTLYTALFFVALISVFGTLGFAIIVAILWTAAFFLVAELVFSLIAAVKAANGKQYCYPFVFSPRRRAFKAAG